MKKIVGMLQPFTLFQQVLVYEDNNKIDIAENVMISDMDKVILNFVDTYDITKIDLVGPVQFSKKIGKELGEAELTRYGKNILEINYI